MDQMHSQDMGCVVIGMCMEDISFIHCLIFSLLESLEKLLLTQVVLDQALRELINVIWFLSTVKKRKVSVSYEKQLPTSAKKMSTSNLFKVGKSSRTKNK